MDALLPPDVAVKKAHEWGHRAVAITDHGVVQAFPHVFEAAKDIKKKGEAAKVAVRNIRRDAIDHFKKAQKASGITEDELKSLEKDMQDLTDKYVKEGDVESGKKEKELMEL